MLRSFFDWRVLHYEHDELRSDWHWNGQSPTGQIVRLLARKPWRTWGYTTELLNPDLTTRRGPGRGRPRGPKEGEDTKEKKEGT